MYHEEFNEISTTVDKGMSVEDRKTQRIMDQSATKVDGHYLVKLPFCKTTPELPDSLPTAEKRLTLLRGKFHKNPVFHHQYSIVIEKYKREGSSREVPDYEVPNLRPVWFLPHHAVWHPRKPRVVFDCASVSGGTSLNEHLLRGAENTTTQYSNS